MEMYPHVSNVWRFVQLIHAKPFAHGHQNPFEQRVWFGGWTIANYMAPTTRLDGAYRCTTVIVYQIMYGLLPVLGALQNKH